MRISSITESITDKGILKAIFFAGSPGSGKTYVSQKLSSGSIEPRIVNTDKAYEFLVKKSKAEFTGKHDQYVDKAIKTTQNQLVHYVNGLLPLFVDGTSNNASNLFRRVGILESLGYDVGMIFVNTDLNVALSRAQQRERKVPDEFVIQTFNRVQKNKEYYQSKFGSNFTEIDNSQNLIDDVLIQQMFKKTLKFFNSPVQNPIGVELKDRMISEGEKYLHPNIMDIGKIKQIVSAWYQ